MCATCATHSVPLPRLQKAPPTVLIKLLILSYEQTKPRNYFSIKEINHSISINTHEHHHVMLYLTSWCNEEELSHLPVCSAHCYKHGTISKQRPVGAVQPADIPSPARTMTPPKQLDSNSSSHGSLPTSP